MSDGRSHNPRRVYLMMSWENWRRLKEADVIDEDGRILWEPLVERPTTDREGEDE